jgi:predicted nucleic acid-binding protein
LIILDNSVLSSFTRLNLLDELEILFKEVFVTKAIIDEYSSSWSGKLPKFIIIVDITTEITLPPPLRALSQADLPLIRLSLDKSLPIASDDLSLRKYAKSLDIKITGSVGLLRAMWDQKIIFEKDIFNQLVTDLQKDVFLSDDLINWVLKDIQ